MFLFARLIDQFSEAAGEMVKRKTTMLGQSVDGWVCLCEPPSGEGERQESHALSGLRQQNLPTHGHYT